MDWSKVTLSSITAAATDQHLQRRVESSAQQEARNNPDLENTQYAKALKNGTVSIQPLMWGVAVATEAAYYAALQNGRGAPGHDTDVITDGDITAAVVANWPPDTTNPLP